MVRVLTPGTLVEPSLLTGDRNNYIAAVFLGRYAIGLAYADVSTGEFALTEYAGPDGMLDLDAEISRLQPAEVLVAEGHVSIGGGRWLVAPVPESTFDETRAREMLMRVLGVRSLDGFGCSGMGPGVSAAGAVLLYLERTNSAALSLFTDLRVVSGADDMLLDDVTLRRLEILENDRGAAPDRTLIRTIDRTKTAIGARLLRRWLMRPLVNREELERRLDLVAAFVRDRSLAAEASALLRSVGDIERLAARARQEIASPRELTALSNSLLAFLIH